MWLLNAQDQTLKYFHERTATETGYAILSHTWADEEVIFQDLHTPAVARGKEGWKKIEFTCRQALSDGLQWVWIDTCCIEKQSSAELSEAINSMYRWYKLARTCYALLSDVEIRGDGGGETGNARTPAELVQLDQSRIASRWFQRGWTLQELIAPTDVRFYDKTGTFIGTKKELAGVLSRMTRIEPYILQEPKFLNSISVAKKMSWASGRDTTRLEDRAYSLLGIFDVNMPLLYGEGDKAFERLQEEILRSSAIDHSILLWRSLQYGGSASRLLAKSPDEFESATEIVHFKAPAQQALQMTAFGLRTTLPVVKKDNNLFALLSCRHQNDFHGPIGMRLGNTFGVLKRQHDYSEEMEVMVQHHAYVFETIPLSETASAPEQRLLLKNGENEVFGRQDEPESGYNFWIRRSEDFDYHFQIVEIHPRDRWSGRRSTICWPIPWLSDTKDIWGYIIWGATLGRSFVTLVFKSSRSRKRYSIFVKKTSQKPLREECAGWVAEGEEKTETWHWVHNDDWAHEQPGVRVMLSIDDSSGVSVEASHKLIMKAYVGIIKLDYIDGKTQDDVGRIDVPDRGLTDSASYFELFRSHREPSKQL